MDGRKFNQNQDGKPKAKLLRTSPNGNPNSSASQLGTRAMVSNAESGLQNGLKTASVSEATNPGSRAEGDVGKNKAPKSPNNTNGPPGQSREHEPFLPIANVVRIMRKALPPHAKVGDEAKETVQECVSEFISFLTSEANATCQQEHRKTVTAEDLIGAMSRLGFEHYVAPLMMYLQKYRENEMLPMISRSSGSHGSNISPPPGFMFPPQYAMFGSAGNGVYYQDPSVPSNGIGNMGQESIAAAAATVTAAGGYGPSSGPAVTGGRASADDGGAGPSWSPQAETGFYDPYGKFE